MSTDSARPKKVQSPADLAEQCLRDWIGNQSKCPFASAFAGDDNEEGLAFFGYEIGPEAVGIANALIDQRALTQTALAVVFLDARSEHDVARVLALLANDPTQRWRVRRASRTAGCKGDDGDEIAIGVHWKTVSGEWSSVLGLASVGTMPATRRAPFLSLIVWGGSKHPRMQSASLGIAHVPTPKVLPEKRGPMMKSTTANVHAFLGALGEDTTGALREVAFRLPRAAVETHLPDLLK